jgi:hypothetical protein
VGREISCPRDEFSFDHMCECKTWSSEAIIKALQSRRWHPATGTRIKELRRGTDKAEIYKVAFRPDEKEVCVE